MLQGFFSRGVEYYVLKLRLPRPAGSNTKNIGGFNPHIKYPQVLTVPVRERLVVFLYFSRFGDHGLGNKE